MISVEDEDRSLSMTKDARLKYIPLFSPMRHGSEMRGMMRHKGLTREEHLHFQKIYEERSSISDHTKYETWLKMYHPFDSSS